MTSKNRFNNKYKRVAVFSLNFKMPLYIHFCRVSVSPLAFFFFFCSEVRQHQPHCQYQKRRKDKKTGNGERVQQKERKILPSENYDFTFLLLSGILHRLLGLQRRRWWYNGHIHCEMNSCCVSHIYSGEFPSYRHISLFPTQTEPFHLKSLIS